MGISNDIDFFVCLFYALNLFLFSFFSLLLECIQTFGAYHEIVSLKNCYFSQLIIQ